VGAADEPQPARRGKRAHVDVDNTAGQIGAGSHAHVGMRPRAQAEGRARGSYPAAHHGGTSSPSFLLVNSVIPEHAGLPPPPHHGGTSFPASAASTPGTQLVLPFPAAHHGGTSFPASAASTRARSSSSLPRPITGHLIPRAPRRQPRARSSSPSPLPRHPLFPSLDSAMGVGVAAFEL
jgi:hypothetical protein